MLKFLQHNISRVIVLVFFCIYALSPIYVSVAFGRDGGLADRQSSSQHVSFGIVWVNIVLSTLTDDAQGDGAAGLQASTDSPDDTMIIVGKKRAVFRDHYEIKPLFEQAALPVSSLEQAVAAFHEFEIPKDRCHRGTDGYRSLNTGLSPPAVLS